MSRYLGRLAVSIVPVAPGHRKPYLADVIEAASAALGIPVREDWNTAGYRDGTGFVPLGYYPQTGVRSSSSVAYLHPVMAGRGNLDVLTGTRVLRVTFDQARRATGVTVRREDGQLADIAARREVIVCCGAIDTPRLLMLSGVGPAGHLRQHGIEVVADLPVGDNLHDHMFVPMTYCMTSARNRGTTPYFAGGVIKEAVRGDTWMGRTVFEAVGFVRSSQARDIPDIQVHALPWSYPFPNQDSPARQKVDKRCALTIMPTLIYPKSRGTVRLASADPAAAPVIDPGLPDRTRRQPLAAGRDRADPRDHGQRPHRRPGQPGAEPGG